MVLTPRFVEKIEQWAWPLPFRVGRRTLSTSSVLSFLNSYDNKIEHYHIKYKHNEYTIDDEESFENLTQMVEHYQKDADGLVTRLKVPVEKKTGKMEYSVDAVDFKKSE